MVEVEVEFPPSGNERPASEPSVSRSRSWCWCAAPAALTAPAPRAASRPKWDSPVVEEVFPSPELPRESDSAEPTSGDVVYLPMLRSGRLLPVKPLPEVPVYPEPAVAGSRGSGLLVSKGSFMPEDAVSVDRG